MISESRSSPPSRQSTPAPYAAAAWAFAFAAISFHWASGGTTGSETVANSLERRALARDPEFVAILWATGALKLLAGLLALALIRPSRRAIQRRLLLGAAYGTGALLTLYGAARWVEAALMRTGIIAIPESVGPTAVRWALFLWEPFWVLGGALFLMAAEHYRRIQRKADSSRRDSADDE